MSAETTTSNNTPASGHVTIVFTSDWGVSTGVGQAGRTHSTIERGRDGQPVVRGTVVAGVLREQAFIAARALDSAAGTPDASGSSDASGGPDIPKGPWENFAEWLFGQHPDLSPGQHPHPRHVVFTDASPIAYIPVHDTVSLSIDPTTGTARNQFLRFTERAAPGVLTGSFTLIDEAGAVLSDRATVNAAHFLLGVAGLMVRGIGSGRSGGDGECTVAVADRDNVADGQLNGEAAEALARIKESVARESGASSQDFTYTTADVVAVAKAVRGLVRGELPKDPPQPRDSKERERLEVAMPSGDGDEAGATWYEATLDITLDSPVVSYEVPFSNEVRSLDFLRGTVLVPWLHGLLRRKFPDEDLVGSAIISGDLRIGDALPVYRDTPGLPIPFVFEEEKVPTDVDPEDKSSKKKPCTLFNRHIPIAAQECGRNTVPLRNRYVFLPLSSDEPDERDGANVSVTGWVGKPTLIGRQSTAIDSSTGAAKDASLFLVRALPAGLLLRCSVVVSERLLAVLRPTVAGEDTFSSGSTQTVELDLGITQEKALLGSRKLTGTFGRARCTLSKEFRRVGSTPSPLQGSTNSGDASVSSRDPIEVSLWFISDVLARSSTLGPGGTITDLEFAFRHAGVSSLQAIQEGSSGDSILSCSKQDEDPCSSGTDDGTDPRNRKHIVTAIRHRRVDSWSPADNVPRATRLAIQAGSVIRVSVASEQLDTLKALGHVGVGELTPQGYGRFKVDSHALRKPKLPLIKTVSKHFTDIESEAHQ